MGARLIVVEGPWEGIELALPAGEQVLGRDASCQLAVPDRSLSRRHFRLIPDGDGWAVEDLGSQNGTTVNGEPAGRRRLAPGDIVAAGRSRFRYESAPVDDIPDEDPGTVSVAVAAGDAAPGDRLSALLRLGDALASAPGLAGFAERVARFCMAEAHAASATAYRRLSGRLVASAAFATDGEAPVPTALLPPAPLAAAERDGKAVWIESGRGAGQLLVPIGVPADLLVALSALARPPGRDDLRFLACAGRLAAGHLASHARVELLAASLSEPSDDGGSLSLIAASPAMRPVLELVDRAAPTDSTVLLLGETGTGKEVIARALHARSRRAAGPFEALNCAALPETLVEAELFGHEKGAFTDAVARSAGRFERAHGGTLFLDEIGELPPSTQARFLRALEDRTVQRLGGAKPVPVDVRIIAATHRDLRAEIEAGRFRQDLYFRLSVLVAHLPPLRERPDDIERLALHFLDRLRPLAARRVEDFSAGVIDALRRYAWPGNVRELRNAVERAVILGRGPHIELGDLPPEIASGTVLVAETIALPASLAEVEHRAVMAALKATGGNKAQAARLLGVDRMTLYARLKDYDLGDGDGD